MTGRQLARVNTVKYGETLWSELYPGNQRHGQLSATCRDSDRKFIRVSLKAQRQRTVWRFDGGAGSDEQFNGSSTVGIITLLAKGYPTSALVRLHFQSTPLGQLR